MSFASFFPSDRSPEFKSTLGAFLVLLFLAIFTNGTADDGDSVHHYLHARWAFETPDLLFRNWGKPLYTLLTAPFAQLGFIGAKIMNVIWSSLAIWFTVLIGRHFGIRHLWLMPIFSLLAPIFLINTLSSLTEPMMGAALTGSVFLILRKRIGWAVVLISFIPFIRSEGLITLCLTLLYLIVRKDFKFIPLLAVGHLVYGLAGWPVHGTPLWPFTTLGYATLEPKYGIGNWEHFLGHLPEIINWVQVVLLVVGIWYAIVNFILTGDLFRKNKGRDEVWLVYGNFLSIFLGHVVFWALGIFMSFGLLRVMLPVLPFASLIALRGLQVLESAVPESKPKLAKVARIVLLVGMIVSFAFVYKWPRPLLLTDTQKDHRAAGEFIQKSIPDFDEYTLYADAPNLAWEMNFNWFDKKRVRESWRFFSGELLSPKSLLLWDAHFMGSEMRRPFEDLEKDKRLKLLFSVPDRTTGAMPNMAIFHVDTAFVTQKSNELRFYRFDTANAFVTGVVDLNGEKVQKLNGDNPYSAGFHGSLESFAPDDLLEISFKAYVEDPENPPTAVLVVSGAVEYQDAYQWDAQQIRPDLLGRTGWMNLRYVRNLPKRISFGNVMDVYLLNGTSIPLYIDDLSIRVIKAGQ